MEGITIFDVIQFVLEIIAFVAVGYWGWTQHDGLIRLLTAFGLPVVVALIWGIFRVPNDPGKATVVIPARLRLALELGIFLLASALLYAAGQTKLGIAFMMIVLLQYILSQRIVFLMTHQ
jgi:hypothetical protein